MLTTIKTRIEELIPEELRGKIATEGDVRTVEGLKSFLVKKKQSITGRWKEPEKSREEKPEETILDALIVSGTSVAPIAGVRFKIILKDAKIVAKKATIRILKE